MAGADGHADAGMIPAADTPADAPADDAPADALSVSGLSAADTHADARPAPIPSAPVLPASAPSVPVPSAPVPPDVPLPDALPARAPPAPRPADPPADLLGELPEALRAEFFEAVRRIIAAAAGDPRSGGAAGGPAIGGDTRPRDEPVRFVAMRGTRHPDAELGAAARGDGGQVRVEAAFMGLTGPAGVMPDHYTELVVARERARDEAFGAFLDLFNHRAISLFYRAWAKYRLPVGFAETRGSLADPVSRALAALAGLTGPGEDPRILGAAGLLARRVRSPDALRRTLAALYGLPVAVIELRPRRIRIDPAERTRIGGRRTGAAPGAAAGAYAGLARDAVLGAATIDVAGRFRVTIGPLDRARFDAFFTPGGLHGRIVATIRQVAGATADFDIQLILRRDAVPRAAIGGGGGSGTRLGQNGWLLRGAAERDRADAILPGRALAAR